MGVRAAPNDTTHVRAISTQACRLRGPNCAPATLMLPAVCHLRGARRPRTLCVGRWGWATLAELATIAEAAGRCLSSRRGRAAERASPARA